MLEKFLAVLTGLVAAIEANTEALKRPANAGVQVPQSTPQLQMPAATLSESKPQGSTPTDAAAGAQSPLPENPKAPVGPVVYADVVAAVQASVKSVGRDATLEKLVGFMDTSGKPLTEKKPDGTWTGSTREAKPEDFAAIIGAVQ